MYRTLPLLLALSACQPKPTNDTDDDTSTPVVEDDTATDTDTDTDGPGPCTTGVIGTEPGTGETGVYYRDPLTVSFDDDGSAAEFTLETADGVSRAFTTTWTDGNVQAVLHTVLDADTTYTLSVDVCGAVTTTEFTTSSIGAPLTVDPATLAGRTYSWRLSDATITQPGFLEAIAGGVLTTPILIGVTDANDATIDMLGVLGYISDGGDMKQQAGESTWDFPAGDFTEAPYFEAYADYITISFSGTSIPIEGFHFSGTFSADGSSIEEGVGEGLGDSRNIGTLMGSDDPNVVCELAANAGVDCVPCGSDGEPYCLYIVAEHITADWEQGLTLTPVP